MDRVSLTQTAEGFLVHDLVQHTWVLHQFPHARARQQRPTKAALAAKNKSSIRIRSTTKLFDPDPRVLFLNRRERNVQT
jgi:hypothetical protein